MAFQYPDGEEDERSLVCETWKGDQVKMLVFCSNQNDIFETKIELGMET